MKAVIFLFGYVWSAVYLLIICLLRLIAIAVKAQPWFSKYEVKIYDILTALVSFILNVSEQLELFNIRSSYRVEQPQKLMSKEALLKWKARIFKHQQRTLNTEPPQQTSLFDPSKSHCDSDLINPFELKLHPSQFYRMKEHQENICIYFINIEI